MRLSIRNSLALRTAGLVAAAVAMTGTAAAQQVTAEPVDPDPGYESVEEAFAAEAQSAPMVQPIPEKILVRDWSIANAQALLGIVESIGTEGLIPADYKPAELRAAIAAGTSPQLNDIASRTFIWLVEDLRDGRTPMDARKQWFVFDPDADRMPSEDLLKQATANGDVAGVLASLAPQVPEYDALKAELAKTPAAQTKKRALIQANMDRWRWLARDLGRQYLITNVPEYQLRLTVNDKIIRTYKTIVGKPGSTATPQLAENVEGVIFNPTWTVPQSIVKGEGLGAKVLGNPAWAQRAGYKATKGANGFVTVVQQPGPTNSLGMMKLDMPNAHAIFLHDTPSRGLFGQDSRALSHGCIRTERAVELAMTLAILQAKMPAAEAVEISKSGEYTRVGFERKMPVYITYFTMGSDIDGTMRSFADIYGRDAPVLESFQAPRKPNRSRVTDEEVVEIIDDLRT